MENTNLYAGNGNSNRTESSHENKHSSSFPPTNDLANLDARENLPRTPQPTSGLLMAPNLVTDPAASLPTFTTGGTASGTAFTYQDAAAIFAALHPHTNTGNSESLPSGATGRDAAGGSSVALLNAATLPFEDVDMSNTHFEPAAAAETRQRELEDYIRWLLTVEENPPWGGMTADQVVFRLRAIQPPYGVGVFAPAVTGNHGGVLHRSLATRPAPAVSTAVAPVAAPTAVPVNRTASWSPLPRPDSPPTFTPSPEPELVEQATRLNEPTFSPSPPRTSSWQEECGYYDEDEYLPRADEPARSPFAPAPAPTTAPRTPSPPAPAGSTDDTPMPADVTFDELFEVDAASE